MAKTVFNHEGIKALAEKFAAIGEVDVRERVYVKEYRLMYLFGGWFTKEKFYAEDDREAIEDADRMAKVASDKVQYALWCGNRMVKRY